MSPYTSAERKIASLFIRIDRTNPNYAKFKADPNIIAIQQKCREKLPAQEQAELVSRYQNIATAWGVLRCMTKPKKPR